MKKIVLAILLSTICIPVATMAGTGFSEEGDTCSVEYIYNPYGAEDTCKPGITCTPLAPGNSNDHSGVCCPSNYMPQNLGTNCSGCHDWQDKTAQYQTKVTGQEICMGNISYTTEYRCSAWYYGTGTDCSACPSHASCPAGSTTFICDKGYYANGSICSPCPSGGTTSGTGATSIRSCCIASGTTFSDSTGSGYYTGPCCAS